MDNWKQRDERRAGQSQGGEHARDDSAEALENAPGSPENKHIPHENGSFFSLETGALSSGAAQGHCGPEAYDRFGDGRSGSAGPHARRGFFSFFRFFGKSDRPSDGTGRMQEAETDGLMAQSSFSVALAGERKRSERTHRPFLLVLLNVEAIVGVQVSSKTISRNGAVRRLTQALHRSTRQIDKKGWFSFGRSIGVIFVETGREALQALEQKITAIVREVVGMDFLDRIGVTWGIFPRHYDRGTAQGVIESNAFYPDTAAERGIVTKRGIKRVIDIVGSVLAIAIFAPLFIVIPLLIKLTSQGPMLFRQERIGEAGQRFVFLKFRSMYVNASEAVHKEYMEKFIRGFDDPRGEKSVGVYKLTSDARITPIGRILRKISFDELPQLFNVLRGDMSLVGPRPAIPYEIELYQLWHKYRMYMKPGITGRWQVKGRSATTFDGMVRMDIQYHERWSLRSDLLLLLMTPISMLSARGAYLW